MLVALVLVAACALVVALDNGVGRTPAMGECVFVWPWEGCHGVILPPGLPPWWAQGGIPGTTLDVISTRAL